MVMAYLGLSVLWLINVRICVGSAYAKVRLEIPIGTGGCLESTGARRTMRRIEEARAHHRSPV